MATITNTNMNALSRMYMDPVLRNLQQPRQLPNGGGSYTVGEGFGGGAGGAWGDKSTSFLNTGAPAPATPAPQPAKNKYINPKTGQYYTPEEYANSVAMKIPASKADGDIGQYAGDAVTNPDESASDLTTRARVMNNTRNDIATGTTDPYKVGGDSGIAYSPEQLAAIEKAYAGIYDPALNDVFTRLKEKEDEQKRIQDREDMVFATNESIRQWQATTGTKQTSSSDPKDLFTQSQLNDGATRAGLTVGPDGAFEQLDNDIINFFVNPPKDVDPVTGKTYDMYVTWGNLVKQVEAGEMTAEEATEEIMSSDLPTSVQHYYIDQLPLEEKKKEGYLTRLWNAVRGK